MKPFIPKNKDIENLMKRIARDGATYTTPDIAKILSRNKKIRTLRQQNKFFIGNDHRKRKSVLFYEGKIKIDDTGIHFE